MSKYRYDLPQLQDRLFMTDGGLETTLVFHNGIDLPYFAAFDLLKDDEGTLVLHRELARYAEVARTHGMGLVLESPTWRANPDWAGRLGYDAAELADANRKAIALLLRIRTEYEAPHTPVVVSGNLGPRGDGYQSDVRMTADQARDYHQQQVETFARTDSDMICAMTLNYVEEAVGIIRAAEACAMPVAISFTLETDGSLPSGETLARAIERTDSETGGYAVYYMINCAHPTHFKHVLYEGGEWRNRIRGVRANASKRSHVELDESTELDEGNPRELGDDYCALQALLPRLAVVGGCCGTDHRHMEAICNALQGRA